MEQPMQLSCTLVKPLEDCIQELTVGPLIVFEDRVRNEVGELQHARNL
jgi:hypothetical protein